MLPRPPGFDERTARWHFWAALSKCGFFVTEYYAFTPYSGYSNCYAGPGSKGQQVVYTKSHGTILWMSSGRVYCPNPKKDTFERLAVFLDPWQPMSNGTQAFDGRFPSFGTSADPAAAVAQVSANPLDFSISPQ